MGKTTDPGRAPRDNTLTKPQFAAAQPRERSVIDTAQDHFTDARSGDPYPAGEDGTASAFLTDLADRVAVLCSQASTTGLAIPLRQAAEGSGCSCHVAAAAQAPELTLYTADGHMRSLEAIEADVFRIAVNHYRGHLSEVARRLDVGRSTVYRKLNGFGIAYPEA